jgi:hypothetical protein
LSDIGQEGNTRRGIEALKAGDKERARQLLAAAILENRDDLQAWLWLSGAVENDTERAACLEQGLRIDPLHEPAVRGLAHLHEQNQPDQYMPVTGPVRQPQRAPVNPAYTPEHTAHAPEYTAYTPEYEADAPAYPSWEAAAPRQVGDTQPGAAVLESSRPAAPLPTPPDEIIFRARPSLAPAAVDALAFLASLIAGALILVGLPSQIYLVLVPATLVGLWFILHGLFERRSEVYTLTNRVVMLEGGLYRGQRRVLALDDLQRIACRPSGLLARLLGLSDLLLYGRAGQQLGRLRDLTNCAGRLEKLSRAAGLSARESI